MAAGLTAAMAAAAVVAYVLGTAGVALLPWLVTVIAIVVGAWFARAAGAGRDRDHNAPLVAWALVVSVAFAALLWIAWPELLPPGGASDLTHHLQLVDVLDRTRQLVDGSAEPTIGEMAHYPPGLHVLVVIAGSLAGADVFRAAYPLLAFTIALKAGFVFLIAWDLATRARLATGLAAVAFVLWAPRAYSLDGFLQAGFHAQVMAELFVVAGWWGLSRWWRTPGIAWMALVALMGAAVFLVWPIWIGPLMVAVGLAVLYADGRTRVVRIRDLAIASSPFTVLAAVHLSQHAAWLRLAGTSGAVPALATGAIGWMLLALAVAGVIVLLPRRDARVTLWFAGGIILQALALWLLARARGAETPYMAIKMIYLAVYPAAILAALAIERLIAGAPRQAAAWISPIVAVAVGITAASRSPVPPPIVSVDLAAAGRWTRANLPPACVGYIVDNAEQAYWLHLAVMGQPRSSPRTADIDGYTANRAIGRWLEGDALPYAIVLGALLPGEVLRDAEVVREFGSAAVIHRRGAACPLIIEQ